jgi:hypothetical protein
VFSYTTAYQLRRRKECPFFIQLASWQPYSVLCVWSKLLLYSIEWAARACISPLQNHNSSLHESAKYSEKAQSDLARCHVWSRVIPRIKKFAKHWPDFSPWYMWSRLNISSKFLSLITRNQMPSRLISHWFISSAHNGCHSSHFAEYRVANVHDVVESINLLSLYSYRIVRPRLETLPVSNGQERHLWCSDYAVMRGQSHPQRPTLRLLPEKGPMVSDSLSFSVALCDLLKCLWWRW